MAKLTAVIRNYAAVRIIAPEKERQPYTVLLDNARDLPEGENERRQLTIALWGEETLAELRALLEAGEPIPVDVRADAWISEKTDEAVGSLKLYYNGTNSANKKGESFVVGARK